MHLIMHYITFYIFVNFCISLHILAYMNCVVSA